MIDPPGELLLMKDLLPERVTIWLFLVALHFLSQVQITCVPLYILYISLKSVAFDVYFLCNVSYFC